jgi:hypothetical protein
MTTYEKDKGFSVGWVVGGAVIMSLLNLFAGLGLYLSGVKLSLPLVAGVGGGCFLVGGFIVGRWSAGRTILEAGLAAALAAGGTAVVHAMRAGRINVASLIFIGVASLVPFVCGIIGGFIGEKVQGDTVEVQD